MSTFIDYNNDMHRELALMAVVAAPDLEEAKAFLQAEHQLISTPKKLAWIRDNYRDQYEELRQRVAPVRERQLAHNLLDNAVYASEVTNVAIAMVAERLKEDRIPAPYLSKVARDLADVQAKAVDKKLSIEGRPTQITETRDVAEIVRALEGMGVMKELPNGD